MQWNDLHLVVGVAVAAAAHRFQALFADAREVTRGVNGAAARG